MNSGLKTKIIALGLTAALLAGTVSNVFAADVSGGDAGPIVAGTMSPQEQQTETEEQDTLETAGQGDQTGQQQPQEVTGQEPQAQNNTVRPGVGNQDGVSGGNSIPSAGVLLTVSDGDAELIDPAANNIAVYGSSIFARALTFSPRMNAVRGVGENALKPYSYTPGTEGNIYYTNYYLRVVVKDQDGNVLEEGSLPAVDGVYQFYGEGRRSQEDRYPLSLTFDGAGLEDYRLLSITFPGVGPEGGFEQAMQETAQEESLTVKAELAPYLREGGAVNEVVVTVESRKKESLPAKLVYLENGKAKEFKDWYFDCAPFVNSSEPVRMDATNEVLLKALTERAKTEGLDGRYEYARMTVWDTEPVNEIGYMKREKGKFFYAYKNTDTFWQEIETETKATPYFVFVPRSEWKEIETLDTADFITLNLFNYNTEEYSAGSSAPTIPSINTGKTFQFFIHGTEAKFDDIGIFNANAGVGSRVNQNIVARNLQDGYPKLAKWPENDKQRDGSPLAYLFDDTAMSGKMSYPNTNYLFRQGADGAYYFNSADSYAEYVPVGNRFRVYEYPKDSDRTGFFPFWPTSESTVTNMNKYSFGMTMEADFYQPENGILNGKPMTFEFAGDDDVWVFIDGVLVLDLGGIHPSIGGSIDFSTGQVKGTINTKNESTNTTLYAAFEAAYKEAGKDTAALNGIFTEVNGNQIFRRNSAHKISFFYMERGAGESNCKLKFNLPVMEKDTIRVSKRAEGAVNADEEYTFELYTGANGSSLSRYESGSYKIYDSSTNAQVGTAAVENGVFKLKAGQYAVFGDIEAGSYYQVKELSTAGFDVQVNGIPAADGVSEVYPSSQSMVEFTNIAKAFDVLADKTARLKNWEDRTYTLDLYAGHSRPVQAGAASNDITGAEITDVIDGRFRLADGEKERLIEDGASVTENSDGTVTVTWTSQTIPYTGTEVNKGWHKVINVKAKETYAGGNNVATNGSYTVKADGKEATAQSPLVNVNSDFALGEAGEIVFRGEYSLLSEILKGETLSAVLGGAVVDANGSVTKLGAYEDFRDVRMTLKWYRGEPEAANEVSLQGLLADSADQNRAYTVVLELNPKAEASENSLASSGNKSLGKVTREGRFTLEVIEGQLTLTKKIDAYYEDGAAGEAIRDNQSFIFRIERYASREDAQKGTEALETFYETISFAAGDKIEKSKIISGLEYGCYKVSEETGWSWKYDLKSARDTDGDETDQLLLVGGTVPTDGGNRKTYMGADIPAELQGKVYAAQAVITYDNKKKKTGILGDVSAIINRLF